MQWLLYIHDLDQNFENNTFSRIRASELSSYDFYSANTWLLCKLTVTLPRLNCASVWNGLFQLKGTCLWIWILSKSEVELGIRKFEQSPDQRGPQKVWRKVGLVEETGRRTKDQGLWDTGLCVSMRESKRAREQITARSALIFLIHNHMFSYLSHSYKNTSK